MREPTQAGRGETLAPGSRDLRVFMTFRTSEQCSSNQETATVAFLIFEVLVIRQAISHERSLLRIYSHLEAGEAPGRILTGTQLPPPVVSPRPSPGGCRP